MNASYGYDTDLTVPFDETKSHTRKKDRETKDRKEERFSGFLRRRFGDPPSSSVAAIRTEVF